MNMMAHKKLNKKFGKVSNVRADKGTIRFDKHSIVKGKEVRVSMSVEIQNFLD
jgi:hypothetical protein